MQAYPTAFDATLSALPLEQLSTAGQQAAQDLAAKGYTVELGLTPTALAQIQAIYRQPSIQAYCLRDSTQRFADAAAAQQWLSKGRAAFLLYRLDEPTHLAGYGWSGRETSPHVADSETTYAIRINEADQGHGLARPYSKLIIEATKVLYGGQHFWLEAWASNAAGVHTYGKLGFVEVGREASERPLADSTAIADTRLYMELPGDQLLA